MIRKMPCYRCAAIAGILALLLAAPRTLAEEAPKEQPTVYPVAVLPFVERQNKNDETGKIVSDILFANLAKDPAIVLVDREDMDKVLEEQGISISGLVDSHSAVKIGNIVGAKILVTGSILKTGSSQYLVAKIIGTETTRVFGASVKGGENDGLDALAEKLAPEVCKIVLKEGDQLVARTQTLENRVAALKNALKDKTLPTLTITIPETHVGREVPDPAAETELNLFATESGFTVLASETSVEKRPDIVIRGEAFSEYAATHGQLISVKARVEIKAVDTRTDKLLASDRQTAVAVDLTERTAAKKALEQCGAALAERILPLIAQ